MKKIFCSTAFLLFFLTGFFISVSASQLTLDLFNNRYFSVRFDNRIYPEPTRNFQLNQIPAGRYWLEIIRNTSHHNSGYDSEIISGCWMDIPPGTHVFARINARNRIQIIRILPLAPVVEPVCQPVPPPYQVISPEHFRQLKNTLRSVSFESTRLSIINQAISNNHLLSRQVRELMELAWFESSRLEIAKKAYPKTMDKENFRMVHVAFQFESSITALNRFIANC